MKVITATEKYQTKEFEIDCFLAGGINKCWEWQEEVIKQLYMISQNPNTRLDYLNIYNPRRKNFPINDPNTSNEQIAWEFENLQKMNIFSMYFCGNTESDQPICFYELGRNLEIFRNNNELDHVIITVEGDFKRVQDVVIQVKLVVGNTSKVTVIPINSEEDRLKAAKLHATKIAEIYSKIIKSKFLPTMPNEYYTQQTPYLVEVDRINKYYTESYNSYWRSFWNNVTSSSSTKKYF